MKKNIVIVLLIIALLVETILLYHKQTAPALAQKSPMTMKSWKGKALSKSMFAKNSYKIYPGDMSDAAKKAFSGWNLKTESADNGSTKVTLIPNESDDTKQTFIIPSGDSLYFVELNPADDQNGTDKNLLDDLGLIVTSKGIIQ